jgi:hypothetical protein
MEDKLELDARVARLERKVALFGAILVFGLVVEGLFLLASVRRAASASAPPAPAPVTSPSIVMKTARPATSVADLAKQLHELDDLRNRGVINGQDLAAKKQRLLDQPLEHGEMKTDLETAQELYNRGTINGQEWQVLKAKVLDIPR